MVPYNKDLNNNNNSLRLLLLLLTLLLPYKLLFIILIIQNICNYYGEIVCFIATQKNVINNNK